MLRDANLATLPGMHHGFFTREGGVSEGIYAARNCGLGSDDAPAAVHENRARAMADLGLPGEALRTVYQVHGSTVETVSGPGGPPVEAPIAMTLWVRSIDPRPLTGDVETALVWEALGRPGSALQPGRRLLTA